MSWYFFMAIAYTVIICHYAAHRNAGEPVLAVLITNLIICIIPAALWFLAGRQLALAGGLQ